MAVQVKANRASVCDAGFPDGSVGKESSCKAGDAGSIPGSGRYLENETYSSTLA